MRLRSPSLLAGLLLLAGATALQGQTLKLGWINSAEILEEAPGARQASEEFNRYLQGSYAEIERMSSELQALMDQYDRAQLTLTPEARDRRQQEIQRKQQEYQARMEELEEQAAQRQQELVQPIMDRVNQVIDQLREEGGYAIIFDVAAGSIIAVDPSLDLTPEVLRRLRANAGGQ